MNIDQPSQVREHGVVARWDEFNSFGFIRLDHRPSGRNGDVFVHVKETGVRLQPGTRVSCVVTMNPRGLRASDVVVES